jgi:hypothetical protein
MTRLHTLLAALPLLALGLAGAASAQTPDGATPASEDICTKWGLSGQVNGLCKAYCEAMDCDDASPQASAQACERVLGRIQTALGDTPFPTCQDSDDDGVPNGLDNCPNVANPDQADANPGTPEGDACEPAPATCPCLGANTEGALGPVPATPEALIASAETFAASHEVPPPLCSNVEYALDAEVEEGSEIFRWLFQGIGACVAESSTFGEETTLLWTAFVDEALLSDAEAAACAAVLDALVAAEPFGACVDEE